MSICILGVQLTPGYSAILNKTKKENTRVAYLGFHFEGVEMEKQSRINSQVHALLTKEEELYILSKEEIDRRLDQQLLQRIRMNLSKEDLSVAANVLNVDHVFVGTLQNQSKSNEITTLVGSLVRYDKASDQRFELNLKSFYDRFVEELATIDQQLVQTILSEKKKGFFARYLPGILIGAVTIVAAALLLGSTGGQGSGGSGGQRPPFTSR